MKRVYESPVMMAEVFEANEYVAGCWDIECIGCKNNMFEGNIVNNDDKHSAHNEVVGRVQTEGNAAPSFEKRNVETSPLGLGILPINNYVDTYNGHWKVEAVNVATAQHPNASA